MTRMLLAGMLGVGLMVVPVSRAAACDCAMADLPDAVQAADLAIIGTLVGRAEPAVGAGPMPVETLWTWEVERSRDPIDASQVSIAAWEDDGANCGTAFGVDERWLVLAHLEGGVLRTNGCMSNQQLSGADPVTEEQIAGMLPALSSAAELPDAGPMVPPAVIPLVAGVVVLGAVSFWAFRRERAR